MRIFITILLTTLLIAHPLAAQIKVDYTFFNRSFDLAQIILQTPQPIPITPTTFSYQPENSLQVVAVFNSGLNPGNIQQHYGTTRFPSNAPDIISRLRNFYQVGDVSVYFSMDGRLIINAIYEKPRNQCYCCR